MKKLNAYLLLITVITLATFYHSTAQQQYLSVPNTPTPPVPGIPPPPFISWPYSLQVWEASAQNMTPTLSPNILLQIGSYTPTNTWTTPKGSSQWGVATTNGMYSSFADGYQAGTNKSGDVVLNAADAGDLIFTNLSVATGEDLTRGAIRFGTTKADEQGVLPKDKERMTILNNGNVGINNNAPYAQLQVTNGPVVFDIDTNGNDNFPYFAPILGPGIRFQYGTFKSALRVGEAIAYEWGIDEMGYFSIGFGKNIYVPSDLSIGMGENISVMNYNSVAIGNDIYNGSLQGIAIGNNCTIIDNDPYNHKSHGFAIGNDVTVNASYAMGLNYGTANGKQSFAVGSKATGDNSIAIGNSDAEAVGGFSTSIGYSTIANGSKSMALGLSSTTNGEEAIGLGVFSTTQAYRSITLGSFNLLSSSYSSTNWVATDPLLILGNGIDANSRSNALTILKNGNTGIGESAPNGRLIVKGNSTSQSNTAFAVFNSTSSTPLFVVREDGFIGVGTLPCSPPTGGEPFKMKINGHLKAKEIVVETAPSGWCDYVFDDSYKLMPLTELESYIQQHNHLPEIPTTAEVEENGIKVAEMQALLLKKVEELTLHVIELNKENIKLKNELNQLKNQQ